MNSNLLGMLTAHSAKWNQAY